MTQSLLRILNTSQIQINFNNPFPKKRKSTEETPAPLSHRKVILTSEPGITKQYSYSAAIQEARDLLVKAYYLTEDKGKQDAVLDLVEVFRNFTEEGRTNMKGMINTTNKPSEAVNLSNAAPEIKATVPSYAQILKSSTQSEITSILPLKSNGMKVLGKGTSQQSGNNIAAAGKTSITPTVETATATTTSPPPPFHHANVITLVTKSGGVLPLYQPFSVRERINKILGKRAISRVHTSVKGNVVLTCMDSSPSELLLDQQKWEPVFEGWPIHKAQKVNHWPKLVVHGVPKCIPIEALNEEIEVFNKGITTQGQPRWIGKTYSQSLRGSVTFSVTTEEEKNQLLGSGVLIGGLWLKVVPFLQSTQKTQCRRCLTYGHHQSTCIKVPVCAFCLGEHETSHHKCNTCQSTQSCIHHAVHCANCKSNTHLAFQKQDCDYYKALSC